MSKWLSIIIPHYNSIDLLEKLVDSIPKDPSIEIIIVDDKSNEDIEKIHLFEEKIKKTGHNFLYNTTQKKGAGVCRNIALEIASGEWVLFADADDYFVEGAFEVVKEACALNKDIVYFPPTSIYLEDGIVADRHENYAKWVNEYHNNCSRKNELLLRYKFLIPSSKLFRRTVIGDIKFDEVIVSNDVMFSTKVASVAENIGVLNKTIYCLTKSSNSLTTKKNKENLEVRVKVFIDRYNYLKGCLNSEEFETLRLSGKVYLAKSILDGYGIKEFLWVYKEYKKNGINVVKWTSLLNDIKEVIRAVIIKLKDKKRSI